MSSVPVPHPPTRLGAALFRSRAALLQLRRGALDIIRGLRTLPRAGTEPPRVLAESRTPLWSETNPDERQLQRGKVQNLRCAARRLHGVAIQPGEVFSFWKQIGRATRRRGYVEGRQLQEGCLIPAVGGGICQLSNALYDVALRSGAAIVERHPHSRAIPGSAAELGRDATVAWNYIDLRLRWDIPVAIEVMLTPADLVVRVRSTDHVERPEPTPRKRVHAGIRIIDAAAHSCASCGVRQCFRHDASRRQPGEERTAFLLDECWPELRRYVNERRASGDSLGIPLDGARWQQRRYAWETDGWDRVTTATAQTLLRSLETRRLGRYGARRLHAQLRAAESLASALSRSLTADFTSACVAQSLLPYLWRDGHLGGRSVEVLMTRLPLRTLHELLDSAYAEHPERATLDEYRAPDWMVRAEWEALKDAERIVTPHAAIAALFPGRSILLEWSFPQRSPAVPGTAIAFPGPTAARKGAYELREAAMALDLEVVLVGSELEGAHFWDRVRTRRIAEGGDWLDGVGVVVQPALVEDCPRRLLDALAAGVPVVATEACGLRDTTRVTSVVPGDADSLSEVLEALLLRSPASASSSRGSCVPNRAPVW